MDREHVYFKPHVVHTYIVNYINDSYWDLRTTYVLSSRSNYTTHFWSFHISDTAWLQNNNKTKHQYPLKETANPQQDLPIQTNRREPAVGYALKMLGFIWLGIWTGLNITIQQSTV